jgi:hypothetical protein
MGTSHASENYQFLFSCRCGVKLPCRYFSHHLWVGADFLLLLVITSFTITYIGEVFNIHHAYVFVYSILSCICSLYIHVQGPS